MTCVLGSGQRSPAFNFNQVILLWTLIFLCIFGAGGSDFSCQKLKTFLENVENKSQIPKMSFSGVHSKVCSKESRTCCSEETERFLVQQSAKEFNAAVKKALSQLSSVLSVRATKFDEFFKKLLADSKRDFDKMFKKTYGVIYEQNSFVFTDLFEELERYYGKGRVDLEEAMENFFNTLYQKMFTVLNSQYQFDEKYLVCIGEHMKDLQPFGDVPRKLSVQIKRSFVATRTFAQALNVARDVVDNMHKLSGAGSCHQALTRMSHCALCQGHGPNVLPCTALCHNVMKGCLAYHSDLNIEWNNFVEAMEKVSERLLGPFNIELVVEPIDIKISEAIMNFQENAHDVSEKVFSGCGRLPLARHVRETRELELQTYKFTKQKPDKKEEASEVQSLETLMRDIMQRVKQTKGYWFSLPYHICVERGSGDDPGCWNGTHIATYTRRVWSNGLRAQHSNPEVSLDTTRPRSTLNEQLFQLRTVTGKLKNAYNGYDVDWLDSEESSPTDLSSGDGSGDQEPDLEGSGEEELAPPAPPQPPQPPLPTSSPPTSQATPPRHSLSLVKAVAGYLFPICVVWLGSILNDWL